MRSGVFRTRWWNRRDHKARPNVTSDATAGTMRSTPADRTSRGMGPPSGHCRSGVQMSLTRRGRCNRTDRHCCAPRPKGQLWSGRGSPSRWGRRAECRLGADATVVCGTCDCRARQPNCSIWPSHPRPLHPARFAITDGGSGRRESCHSSSRFLFAVSGQCDSAGAPDPVIDSTSESRCPSAPWSGEAGSPCRSLETHGSLVSTWAR